MLNLHYLRNVGYHAEQKLQQLHMHKKSSYQAPYLELEGDELGGTDEPNVELWVDHAENEDSKR